MSDRDLSSSHYPSAPSLSPKSFSQGASTMPGVTGSFRNPARRMVWAEGTHLPLSRGLRIILSGSNPPALTPCAGFLGLPQKTVPQARGLNNKNLFPQGPGCWKSPQSHGWLARLVPSEAPLLGLCVCAMSLQSCPTLCDPKDCSSSGSSVHGILQARILERIAKPSSRGSS